MRNNKKVSTNIVKQDMELPIIYVNELQTTEPYVGETYVRICKGVNPRGFSLLELLAVLIIIATLSVIAIAIFSNKSDIAKQTAFYENVNVLQKQAQFYLLNQVAIPTGDITATLVSSGLVKEIPLNPLSTGPYTVVANANGTVTVNVGFNGTHNIPKFTKGMTPLIYNGTNDFRDASIDEIASNSWYSYRADLGQTGADRIANERWANIRLADGSMFVWIPRYTYDIKDKTGTSQIWIKYSNGISDDTSVNVATGHNFIAHPAFNFGGVQLNGIWVAKFEACSSLEKTSGANSGGGNANLDTNNLDGRYIQSLPGKYSWRAINISNIFDMCYNIQANSTYGILNDRTKVDTHMMKNSEWGAAAYLTESIRDRTQVTINADANHYTGGSNDLNSDGKYEEIYENQKAQSSTGNAYGIYDLSGNSWEYVASYVANGKPQLTGNGNSLVNANKKYKDELTLNPANTDQGQNNNYSQTASQTNGMAIHEVATDSGSTSTTSAFQGYGDYQWFPNNTFPFFERGGRSTSVDLAGIFAFDALTGVGDPNRSFRPVLIVLPD